MDWAVQSLIMTKNFPMIKILLDNNHITKEYYFSMFREVLDQNKNDYDNGIDAYYRSIYTRLHTILEITSILIDDIDMERAQYLMDLILQTVEYQYFDDKEQIMPMIEKLLAMDAKIPYDMIMHVSYDIFLQHVRLDMTYDESFVDKCLKYGSLDMIMWITKYIDQYDYDVTKMAMKTFPLSQNYSFDYYFQKLDEAQLNYVFLNLCLYYKMDVDYIYERWKIKNWFADAAVSLLVLMHRMERRLVEKNICDCVRKYMDERHNLKKHVIDFLTPDEHYQRIKKMNHEKMFLDIDKYYEYVSDANALLKAIENIDD